MRHTFVGSGTLIRLAARRDRVIVPSWVAAVIGVMAITASTFKSLYPTPESRIPFAFSIERNPALRAMVGPPFDLTSIGGLTAWRFGGFAALLIGLMSLMIVTRHTRAEEESGRLELVGAGVVGRNAPLTAALVAAAMANATIAVGITVAMVVVGEPLAGSAALGLGLAVTGMCFAAVASVTVQVAESTRAANGLAGALLGLSYLLRAIGDSTSTAGSSWPSWLSPIGWSQQVRPFANERWWVLALPVLFASLCLAVGFALVHRRDLGRGMLPTKPGPEVAAPRFASSIALAWRLHRGALLGWTVAFAILGAAIGSIAQGVTDLLESSPQMLKYIELLGGSQGLVDAYLAAIMSILGLAAAGFAISATLRLHTEETAMRAEPVLATTTTRIAFAGSHLVMAVLGTAIVLLAGGTATGIVHGLRVGAVGEQVPRLVSGALVQLPATLVLAGLAMALIGVVPRFTSAVWAALIAFALVGQLGSMLRLPTLLLDLSPFSHVPKLPGGTLSAEPVLALMSAAITLAAIGLVGFRHRDIG